MRDCYRSPRDRVCGRAAILISRSSLRICPEERRWVAGFPRELERNAQCNQWYCGHRKQKILNVDWFWSQKLKRKTALTALCGTSPVTDRLVCVLVFHFAAPLFTTEPHGKGGMLKYLIRPNQNDSVEGEPAQKKAKDVNGEEDGGPLPSTFLSWNANSFANRCKNPDHISEFARVVEEHDPDIIAIQEVRLMAAAPFGAKRGDGKPRNRSALREDDNKTKDE
eukprot:2250032-Rhodomonas_salina.1